MITVSDLKEACEQIEREYGSDANVIIQLRKENDALRDSDYCIDIYRDAKGNLFLSNRKFEFKQRS